MKRKPGADAHWSKKLWYFIWHDDSIWSWIVNIIVAFILIKFIVYPGLGLILGTQLPLVAVISESMDHNGNFEEWWGAECEGTCPYTSGTWYREQGIDHSQFTSFPLHRGFNRGDVILLVGAKPNNLEVGDVIVFASGREYPIIHRIFNIENDGTIQTKGDANPAPIVNPELNELAVQPEHVIGRAVLRIPWLGYLKLLLVDGIGLVSG